MRTLRCASAPGVEPGRSQPERGQQRRRTTASFLRLRRLRLFLAPRSPVLAHPFGDRLALFLGHRALAPGDGPDRLLPAAPGGWRAVSCDHLDGVLSWRRAGSSSIAPRCAARPGFRSSTSRPASSEATRRGIAPAAETHERAPPRTPPTRVASLPGRRAGFGRRVRGLKVVDHRTHLGRVPRRPVAAVGQPRHSGTPAPCNRGHRRLVRTVLLAQGEKPHRRFDRRQRVVLPPAGVRLVNVHRRLRLPVQTARRSGPEAVAGPARSEGPKAGPPRVWRSCAGAAPSADGGRSGPAPPRRQLHRSRAWTRAASLDLARPARRLQPARFGQRPARFVFAPTRLTGASWTAIPDDHRSSTHRNRIREWSGTASAVLSCKRVVRLGRRRRIDGPKGEAATAAGHCAVELPHAAALAFCPPARFPYGFGPAPGRPGRSSPSRKSRPASGRWPDRYGQPQSARSRRERRVRGTDAQETRERLDTALTEANHACHRELSDEPRRRVGGERFDGVWSDNRGATGCAGARLISSLSSLPGLK